MEGVEPLHHGAALAAVEVDGVAELAHARADRDEAEEDAEREEDDAEVHPAAGVVGVPDGVLSVPPLGPALPLLPVPVRLVPVRIGSVRLVPVRLARLGPRLVQVVVGALGAPHRGQQRRGPGGHHGVGMVSPMPGIAWVAPASGPPWPPGPPSGSSVATEDSRTAWRRPVAPGVDFPVHTTGRRRGPPPARAPAPDRAAARRRRRTSAAGPARAAHGSWRGSRSPGRDRNPP